MKALLNAFDASDWQEMTVTIGTDTLHVSRQANGTGPVPAPPPPPAAGGPAASESVSAPAPAPAEDGPSETAASTPGAGTVVESPSVGLFWRAPSPGAPPFVEVGANVAEGDTVAIIEVMKLMNHVTAPVTGAVTSILVENGDSVEYGQALITVDPEG